MLWGTLQRRSETPKQSPPLDLRGGGVPAPLISLGGGGGGEMRGAGTPPLPPPPVMEVGEGGPCGRRTRGGRRPPPPPMQHGHPRPPGPLQAHVAAKAEWGHPMQTGVTHRNGLPERDPTALECAHQRGLNKVFVGVSRPYFMRQSPPMRDGRGRTGAWGVRRDEGEGEGGGAPARPDHTSACLCVRRGPLHLGGCPSPPRALGPVPLLRPAPGMGRTVR